MTIERRKKTRRNREAEMRVSVIVPLYNKAAYIERALRSIVAQTWRDIEIIVVDDGSTDLGAEIARAFPDGRIRVLRQANAGPGAARNYGVAEAAGDFVAFLDADDEWLPSFLERSMTHMSHPEAPAFVSTGFLEHPITRLSEAAWRGRGIAPGLQRWTPQTSVSHAIAMLAFMTPCTTVGRRSVLDQLGGFYDRNRCVYGEDADLYLRALLKHDVYFDLEPQAIIHRDASELSNTADAGRPVEPFVLEPERIRATCSPHLRTLLDDVLATRAFKTACVLAFWGDWRAAAAVRDRFQTGHSARLPLALVSRIMASRAGPILGRSWRALFGTARPAISD